MLEDSKIDKDQIKLNIQDRRRSKTESKGSC